MESIERFEKMSFSDFCDDLDDEEYEDGGMSVCTSISIYLCMYVRL